MLAALNGPAGYGEYDVLTGSASPTDTSTPSGIWSRTISYQYDGLQRLTGAVESPGSSFTYSYDLAGNRTGVSINGAAAASTSYDAADQVQGWTYDQAGNLINDGATSYRYDALNRLTTTIGGAQSSSYSYNGDGTLVGQSTNGAATSYTQDLAAGQSQILVATTSLTSTDYLYGTDTAPLVALTGSTRTWYGTDGQGSVRQTLDDSGSVLGTQSYDPFGQPETGSTLVSSFGYTGELQNSSTGAEYLRARWYQPGTGQLLGVDPLLDLTGSSYIYTNDNPVNGSDPTGQCTFPGGQLAGIEGAGSCASTILATLMGSKSTVGRAVGPNDEAVTRLLNQELAAVQVAGKSAQPFEEGVVLNPGQCPNPNACAVDAYAAAGAAGGLDLMSLQPNAVVARSGTNDVTAVFLGTSGGRALSISVLIENGVVTLGIATRSPTERSAGENWISQSCGALGAFVAVAAPVGQGTLRGAGEGWPGLVAAGTITLLALLFSNAISNARSTTSSSSNQQWNRGSIQIQGNDISGSAKQSQTTVFNRRFGMLPVNQQGNTISSPWSRTTPISASEGRSRLALLWTFLNNTQKRNRSGVGTGPNRVGAYSSAVDWINSCIGVGCFPPGHNDFHDANRSDTSYRIDIVINSGFAFNVP